MQKKTDKNKINILSNTLRDQVRLEETSYGQSRTETDSLWDHLERVARLATRLGRTETQDPLTCHLAGLFHDAGKFAGGQYHKDDRPEEEHSVETLRNIARPHDIDPDVVDKAAEAILQLYRDDPDPTPIAQVLFDADNLDKLGQLGVANYFVKVGLRGKGVSPASLHRLTVELTYARHAPQCLMTPAGRDIAGKRATATILFIKGLLSSLQEDGLYDFRIDEVTFAGLGLDIVTPRACDCRGALRRKIWEVPGIKCSEIHLEHTCGACGKQLKLRFCRPRLLT